MIRAYTTDRAPGAALLEQHRQAERRRWFERIVMLPVSLGMVMAFIALATAQVMIMLDAPSWISNALPAMPIVVAVAASAVGVARWIRR